MTSDAVHYLSLVEVSGRLRRGELKPTTLSETILARIAQRRNADRTRRCRRSRNGKARAGSGTRPRRGPLHGVPIAVGFVLHDTRATAGRNALIHKDFIPPIPLPW